MARIICLETDDGEVFVNLENFCQAKVTADAVEVDYNDGRTKTFTGAAAHTLIQALRHEERRTSQQS